jgi:hypothetical protein
MKILNYNNNLKILIYKPKKNSSSNLHHSKNYKNSSLKMIEIRI